MYDEGCNDRQEDAEADAMETNEGVIWRYYSVAVLIEEVAMLLQHSLVRVLLGPAIGLRAEWAFGGGSDVDAGGTCFD